MDRQPIIVPRCPECPYKKSFGYIYLLTNRINGHKYVGKHVYKHPYRDNSYWASGGEHLQNALQKLNNDKSQFDYEILEWVENLGKEKTKDLAIYLAELEIYYISLLGTFENPEDYNETPGGDNWQAGELNPMYNNHRFAGKNHPMYGRLGEDNPRTGMKHTEIAKKKMSEIAKTAGRATGEKNPMYGVHMTGKDNPFYGKRHTAETKRKISEANTGRTGMSGEKNPMYGVKFGNHPRAKSIVQLTLNLDLVRVYASRSEAELQGFDGSTISDCCKGKTKTHRGFRWMYKSDYDELMKGSD